MRNQKILLVIDRLTNPHAGTEGQFMLLIQLLMASGLDVRAIVLASSSWIESNKLPCPTNVVGSSSIKSPKTWFCIYSLARALKKNHYDLAHIFFNDASVICPPMFKLAGIKTIISRRDMGFWYNTLYRLLLPITGRCVDLVISNSHAVSDVTGYVEKIPASKRIVIYNGYNRTIDKSQTVPELQILKERGAILVGLVANIRPIKRIQDAITALSMLPKGYEQLNLVIIGSGDSKSLVQLAESLNVADRIHFLGGRSDIPNCLSYFAAGLLCSESEGFSNAIVEYQFSGLPVICTHTGGNPEAVENTITGWLYEVGDIAGLRDAFGALLNDPDQAAFMGLRAQKIATERYSIEKMLNNHIHVYNSLVSV